MSSKFDNARTLLKRPKLPNYKGAKTLEPLPPGPQEGRDVPTARPLPRPYPKTSARGEIVLL